MPPEKVPKTKNLLVKWLDCKLGPCRDVVHQDRVVDDPEHQTIEEGQTRFVKCGKAEVRRKCVILRKGSERGLKLLHVCADGSIMPNGPCIPTRRECEYYHALKTRRAEAQNLADNELFNNFYAVEDVVDNSGNLELEMNAPDEGTVCDAGSLEDVISMAKNLPADASKEAVRRILWSLPCLRLRNHTDEKPLVPGMKCYGSVHELATLYRNYKDKKPGLFMGALVRFFIPERILALPHLTARGKQQPGTVAIPKPIYESIVVYMEHRGYKPKNGFANAFNGIINTCRTKFLESQLAAKATAPFRRLLEGVPKDTLQQQATLQQDMQQEQQARHQRQEHMQQQKQPLQQRAVQQQHEAFQQNAMQQMHVSENESDITVTVGNLLSHSIQLLS